MPVLYWGTTATRGVATALLSCHTRPAARSRSQCYAAVAEAPSAADMLITVEDVSKSHDGMRILFEELNFSLARGQRMAIIGANGSGKTSLLKLLAGSDFPDDGTVDVKKGVHVSYLPQLVDLPSQQTALGAVVQSDSPVATIVREYNRLLEQGEDVNRQELNKAMDRMNALGAWELETKAKDVLALLGLSDPNMKIEAMSGGQARKVAVASALLGTPEVLILDEPTNHMDVQFIDWMSETIKSSTATLLLVTHDRAFMEDCCTSILELDSGRGYVHNVGGRGSYKKFRERRAERRAAQAAAAQDAKVVLRKETVWMSKQPKARESKSKARVDNFEELSAKAKSGPQKDMSIDFRKISSGMARQGKKVMVMKDCTKLWDGRAVIDSFSYDFAPGERIGIAGPNGSGKSTLLDMITGNIELDSGLRVEGDTTVVGYFRQHPPAVNPKLKIIDHVTSQAQRSADKESVGVNVPPDKMLDMLGFGYQRQQQYVSSLSGGERRRLHLASILAMKPNLLILDEPTNDLDLSTIENLEELLRGYLGCVIVVSHDRAFMKNAVDNMFVLEGDSQGKVQRFAGDYEEYLAFITKRKAEKQARETAAANAARQEIAAAKTAASQGSGSNGADEEKQVRKLGFREKDEYAKLETQIEDVTEEKAQLEAKIAETAQLGDFQKVAEMTEQLPALSEKIDKMTDRWLELAERAEIAGTV